MNILLTSLNLASDKPLKPQRLNAAGKVLNQAFICTQQQAVIGSCNFNQLKIIDLIVPQCARKRRCIRRRWGSVHVLMLAVRNQLLQKRMGLPATCRSVRRDRSWVHAQPQKPELHQRTSCPGAWHTQQPFTYGPMKRMIAPTQRQQGVDVQQQPFSHATQPGFGLNPTAVQLSEGQNRQIGHLAESGDLRAELQSPRASDAQQIYPRWSRFLRPVHAVADANHRELLRLRSYKTHLLIRAHSLFFIATKIKAVQRSAQNV